jgi:hypothetical protein
MNKLLKIAAVVISLLVVILIGLAPIGPMPGVFIGGKDTSAPAVWGNTSAEHEIRLKVPGTIPRVVIIWVIQYENDLYIVGSKESGWVKMLGQGGNVDMRLGDNTYSLNASMVVTDWQPVLTAYMDKYRADCPDIVNSFPAAEEAKDSTAVFKLSRG